MSPPLDSRRVVTAFLGLLLGSGWLEAQPRNLRFDHLSLEAGLSQSAVNAVIQDHHGFIWVGTEDGLNRYDGTGFEVFKHDPDDARSLSHSWVSALLEDSHGNLWLATLGGGINRWNPGDGTFQTFRNDPADAGSLSHDKATALAEDPAGGLWVGTEGGGLNHLDPATGRFTHFGHDPGDPHSLSDDKVMALLVDSRERLWVATLGGGLNRLDPGADAFVRYRHETGSPRSLCDDRLRALGEDSQGRILIASFECGLSRLEPSSGDLELFRNQQDDPRSLTQGRVRTLLEDSAGTLWVGTTGGLNALTPEDSGFTRYVHHPEDRRSLPDDSVTALLEDRGGVLWVGTQRGGLSRCNIRTGSFPHYRAEADAGENLSHPFVNAIQEGPDGALWVGTLGGGLDRLDRRTGRVTNFRHDPGNPRSLAGDRVMSLLVDQGDRLWVGTYAGGLDRWDPDTRGFVHYASDPARPDSLSYPGVMSLYQDRDGVIWVGTFRGGLNRLGEDGAFRHYRHDPGDPESISGDMVMVVLEDGEGDLWVGTDAGLDLLDRATGSFRHHSRDEERPDSLSHDAVMSLAEGRDGTLWIGTQGGLNGWSAADRAQGRPRFRRYTERHGLPNNWIYGILEDATGQLWLSTNQGLSRFDPQAGSFTNYGRSHGLQSTEFNFGAHFRSPSGELFFGGINGLNAFFPDRIRANQYAPPVVLTAFLKFGRPVELEGPVWELQDVAVGHRDYAVAFEFAALDYTNPAGNRYAHKLEGFDPEWTQLGTGRRATYTNLPPGRYTLRVRASNSDGVWNEEGLSLGVLVTPAPWRTGWAYALYVLALGAIVFAYMRAQARKLKREAEYSQKLEREVRQRTRELEEASLTDPLTGLQNRRYLMTQVQQDIALLKRRLRRGELGKGEGALPSYLFLMIDLDGLKQLNDVHGHAAGDEVLRQMRDLLVTACRTTDTIIRWGGDEFLVVGRDVDRRFAETVAERIRSSVREHPFTLGAGRSIRLSCSIGFAFYPFVSRSPDLLLADHVITIADRALYVAKRGGRDAWVGLYANEATPTEDLVRSINEDLTTLVRSHAVEISSSLGTREQLVGSEALPS